MQKLLLTSIALLASAGAMAQNSILSPSNLRESFAETSVHDPSVVYDNNGTYYIFGSHLAVSKTTDLKNWTSNVGGGETTNCTLFANTSGAKVGFADAYNSNAVKKVKNRDGKEVTFGNFNIHDWQFKGDKIQGNQWAPDVIWNPVMKKWLMYMSVNANHWASVIVCLAADKIEGPYIYQGPVVFSGFQGTYEHNGFAAADDWKNTDFAIATGETSLPARYKVGGSWGTYWPNCIDPCITDDGKGNLYMTYGSWSGGIFQIQLDETTGLRDYTVKYPYEVNGLSATPGAANANCTSDPYFGKKLAGGYYVSGEGAFLEKIGDYYHLFLSYGGLESNKGYEMRVFRSKNIDGPYETALYSSYMMNYGKNAATNKGYRVLGSMADWGTMGDGEVAQGHNSLMVDNDGDAFLVYHTRFVSGGEGHQVRVRQLFVNKDGFLVASPFRYTGKQTTQKDIESKRLFDAAQLSGTYKLLFHPYKLDCTTKQTAKPITVTLNSDGTYTGDKSGTWEFTDANKSYINITYSGLTYKGVALRQNVDGMVNTPAVCISAVCEQNNYQSCLWLYKEENEGVKATTFYPESNIKNTSAGWWTNFSKNQYAIEPGDELHFNFYNHSIADANYKNWCLYGANDAPGTGGYKEYFGIRNDNWDNTTGSNTGCSSNFDWNTFPADMNGSLVNMTVKYTAEGVFTMNATITTTTNKKYSYTYSKTISSKPASIRLFFVNEGSYIDGTTLGIDKVNADRNTAAGRVYNLSGQQVNDTYKGIVIRNGKKYIKN